jgi:hypothetical protein
VTGASSGSSYEREALCDMRHSFSQQSQYSGSCQHNPKQGLIMFVVCGALDIGRVAILGSPLFPFAAVERFYGHRFDGIAVDAARVDADSVGM